MTITTKYNIGDKVWVMRNDHPIQDEIDSIEMESTKNMPNLVVCVFIVKQSNSQPADIYRHNEIYCFPTKEELLKSL